MSFDDDDDVIRKSALSIGSKCLSPAKPDTQLTEQGN